MNQKPGISPGLQRITVGSVILFVFLISAFVGPKVPDKVPRQQIRDSIGAAKHAYYCEGCKP